MKVLRLGQSLCSSGGGSPETAFVFTADTTLAGSSGVGSFTLPLIGASNSYDVDWGDGNSDTSQTSAITHAYSSGAIYTIKISGTTLKWQFGVGSSDAVKMKNIANWGIFHFPDNVTFAGCVNMTCSATDAVTVTGTKLSYAFYNCPLFNGSMNNWDVSNVTRFENTFFGATIFNQPLDNWDTSSGTYFNKMFQSALAFNQNVGDWDISSAINLTAFLYSATALTLSTSNLDAILIGWAAQSVNSGLSVSFGSANYTAAAATAYNTLDVTNSWTIVSGGQV